MFPPDTPDVKKTASDNLQSVIADNLAKQTEDGRDPEAIERGVGTLENSTAICLQGITILTPLGGVPLTSWLEVVNEFIEKQVGLDASPAVKLAAEQALILHFSSLALRVTSAGSIDPTVVQCNVSLATAMQAELRRLVGVLEQYRTRAKEDGGIGLAKPRNGTNKSSTKQRKPREQSVA